MIQILTVTDIAQKQSICAKAAIPLSDDLHIIAVFENNDIVSQGAVFRYEATEGEILWLDMGEEFDLTEGLARSVLSIMEIRGVKKVSLPLTYETLAQKLNFFKCEDKFEVSLEGFFCCNCQHK